MPNRYEREIEEILSRMEDSEPRKGIGDRIRPFRRGPARQRQTSSLHINLVEILFFISIVLIMLAAGLAYYFNAPSVITGAIAAVGLVFFVVALVAGWRDRFRPSPQPQWRRGTVSTVTPIHRNPFSFIATQFRILRLRLQYRRARENDPEGE